MKRALSIGLAHEIRIVAPFAALHKRDVIVLGASLGVPFAFTLSCLNRRAETRPRAPRIAGAAANVESGYRPSRPRD